MTGEWLLECEDCEKKNYLNNEGSARTLKRIHEAKRPTHSPGVRYVGAPEVPDAR